MQGEDVKAGGGAGEGHPHGQREVDSHGYNSSGCPHAEGDSGRKWGALTSSDRHNLLFHVLWSVFRGSKPEARRIERDVGLLMSLPTRLCIDDKFPLGPPWPVNARHIRVNVPVAKVDGHDVVRDHRRRHAQQNQDMEKQPPLQARDCHFHRVPIRFRRSTNINLYRSIWSQCRVSILVSIVTLPITTTIDHHHLHSSIARAQQQEGRQHTLVF